MSTDSAVFENKLSDQISLIFGIFWQSFSKKLFLKSIEKYISAERQFYQLFINFFHKDILYTFKVIALLLIAMYVTFIDNLFLSFPEIQPNIQPDIQPNVSFYWFQLFEKPIKEPTNLATLDEKMNNPPPKKKTTKISRMF